MELLAEQRGKQGHRWPRVVAVKIDAAVAVAAVGGAGGAVVVYWD